MTGWSFCIITDGKEIKKTYRVIQTIIDQHIPEYEILIAGRPSLDWAEIGCKLIDMPDAADNGRLGEMRNVLCHAANYENLVVMDDDIELQPGWYNGMLDYGDYQVLSCRILNPDGTRYWDWKANHAGKNWLIDYDKTSEHISITGGFIVMKSWVFERCKWDNDRGFNQEEDVDYTDKLKRAHVHIAVNVKSTVIHQSRYTSDGYGVYIVGGGGR